MSIDYKFVAAALSNSQFKCYVITYIQTCFDRTIDMLKKTAFISLAIACSAPVLAQQAAHVHGFASINLAIDGDELQIEFVSPAESIVGFEYEPSTAAERKAVAEAIALLRKPEKLFDLPASAGCELHEVEAERHAEDEHDEHADHQEHDKEHAKYEGHDEEHEHEHAEHDEHAHEESGEGESHSEFHAHYHFDCNGSAIETVGLRLFETWPRIEEVRLQALTPGGQTGGNIEANDPVIRLQ